MNDNEKLYTSTKTKLLHHLDRLIEIQNSHWRPISVQFAPTDKCNLNCDFCSVKERDGDEIEFNDAKKAIQDFRELGAKSIEFTGGGDPTMYKRIYNLINYSSDIGYKTGLITNGIRVKSNIPQSSLDRLDWMRISLNSLDYVDEIDVPEIKGTLGFSYVINDRTTQEKLDQVVEYKNKYNAEYVRLVPNCLTKNTIEKSENIARRILDEEGVFYQQKERKKPERCWIGYLKPFVAPDGYIYTCSAIPLISRRFDEKFRIGNIKSVKSMYGDKITYSSIKPFDTKYCQDDKCFFREHNEVVEEVIRDVKHGVFL